jgi:flagellar hook-associated protein 2
MTTSSVGSSGSTSAASTASNSSNTSTGTNSSTASTSNQALGQTILTALGAGSGVNVASLAQSLVNATEVPQANIINTQITHDQSKISGLSAVSYVVQEVQTAMTKLADQSNFNNLTVSNTGSGMFTVTTTTAAQAGTHTVAINSIASAQSVLSNSFAAGSVSLNGGNAFTVQIQSGSSNLPSVISIPAGSDTPQGIVNAINASPNSKGIQAQLINTGNASNPYQIQLTGATGAANSFTLTTDTSNSAPPLDGSLTSVNAVVSTGSPFNLNLSVNFGASSLIHIPVNANGNVTVGDALTAINNSIGAQGYSASLNSKTNRIQIADSKGNVQMSSMTSYQYDPDLSSAFVTSPASLNNASAFNVALTVGGSSPVQVNIPANATTASVVANIQSALIASGNSTISGDKVSFVNTGTSTAPAYQIQIVNPASGAAQALTFSAYQPVALSASPPSLSGTFASTSVAVNPNSPFSLNVAVAGQGSAMIQIPANSPLSSIVSNINTALAATPATTGDTASLVNTGTDLAPAYQIQITNSSKVVQSINLASALVANTPLSSPISGLNLGASTVVSASNASLTVDGVNYSRTTNSINDIISGATLSLTGTTPAGSPSMVTLTQNTATTLTNIQALVTAYNDSVTMIGDVTNPKSTLATYGATLVGSSTVMLIQNQLRAMVSGQSSTPGAAVGSLWQMGITLTSTGNLTVNTATLNTALQSNYSDVVKTFTGNLDNSTYYGTSPGGIAGDAVKSLTTILSTSGPIQSQTKDANTDITKQQTNLADLQSRMAALLTQYTSQFAAMDSFVGEMNAERTSLTSTFNGMMAMYTNK